MGHPTFGLSTVVMASALAGKFSLRTPLNRFAEGVKRISISEWIRRNPLYYGQAVEQLKTLEKADLYERREWTQRRLRTVLTAASRTRYGVRVGGTHEIGSWPLLGKEKLRDDGAAFMHGRQWFTAPASTGGTTGLPLKLCRSMQSVAVEQAYIDSAMRYAGIDEQRCKIAVLRGDNIKDPSECRPPYWSYAQGGRRLLLSSNMLSRQTIHDYAEVLAKFQPDVLYSYPTSLESLCRLLRGSGMTVRIPHVVTSSEVLKRAAWHLAQETLGCRVVDYYGQAERLAFACALSPREYRFLPGYGHIELIPFESDVDSGAEAGRLYEIVGTSLWNLSMPLVRYRTGDLIRLPKDWGEHERQELVHGLRTFSGVLGREQEILVCPQGVRLTGIDHIPRDVAHVLRIQVVQDTLDSVRIRVLAAEDFSQDDADQLLQNARSKIPRSMQIQIEVAESLEHTPRGKTPLVIHRAPVQEMLRTAGIEPALTYI